MNKPDSAPHSPPKKARFIPPSRELQLKVGRGMIDEKKIEEAQKIIDQNVIDFIPIARSNLDKLAMAIAAARAADDTIFYFEQIKQPIMNLKSCGSVFSYPLVSELTSIILDFFETLDRSDKSILEIAEALQKSIEVVVSLGLKGDGGDVGKVLSAEFRQVCRRYLLRREAELKKNTKFH